MQRRASGQDVAREAGVSQSTVSLVLSGKPDTGIPEATRARVLDAAHRLRYSRNATARALITGRTHRIGIVPGHPSCFQDTAYYYGEILAGIMRRTLSRNYNLLFYSRNYPDWHGLVEDIANGATDGALLIGRALEDPVTKALLDGPLPIVCLSYHPEQGAYHAVDCDNEMAGCLAMRHLLELDHRNIVFMHLGEESTFLHERCQGAQRALRAAGLPPECLRVQEMPADEEGAVDGQAASMRAALAFLQTASPRPTAVLHNDEPTARAIAEWLPRQGLQIPKDLSLITFNSTELSARCRPPLTSVWQPLQEIGAAAVEMLANLIEGRDAPAGTQRFSVRLDVRCSSAPPRSLASL